MTTTDDYPKPPSLHWGLVFLFYILTFGIFGVIWSFRQAAWVRRLDRRCNAVFVLVVPFVVPFILILFRDNRDMGALRLLLTLSFLLAPPFAFLMMRDAIQDRFVVKLNVFLTVVFLFVYLQYHMTRIAKGEYALRDNGLPGDQVAI